MSYKVTFAKSIVKMLKKFPLADVTKIISKAESLSEEPYPFGCKKLRGSESLWHLRMGNYRIIYFVEEQVKVVKITKIGHRKNIYE